MNIESKISALLRTTTQFTLPEVFKSLAQIGLLAKVCIMSYTKQDLKNIRTYFVEHVSMSNRVQELGEKFKVTSLLKESFEQLNRDEKDLIYFLIGFCLRSKKTQGVAMEFLGSLLSAGAITSNELNEVKRFQYQVEISLIENYLLLLIEDYQETRNKVIEATKQCVRAETDIAHLIWIDEWFNLFYDETIRTEAKSILKEKLNEDFFIDHLFDKLASCFGGNNEDDVKFALEIVDFLFTSNSIKGPFSSSFENMMNGLIFVAFYSRAVDGYVSEIHKIKEDYYANEKPMCIPSELPTEVLMRIVAHLAGEQAQEFRMNFGRLASSCKTFHIVCSKIVFDRFVELLPTSLTQPLMIFGRTVKPDKGKLMFSRLVENLSNTACDLDPLFNYVTYGLDPLFYYIQRTIEQHQRYNYDNLNNIKRIINTLSSNELTINGISRSFLAMIKALITNYKKTPKYSYSDMQRTSRERICGLLGFNDYLNKRIVPGDHPLDRLPKDFLTFLLQELIEAKPQFCKRGVLSFEEQCLIDSFSNDAMIAFFKDLLARVPSDMGVLKYAEKTNKILRRGFYLLNLFDYEYREKHIDMINQSINSFHFITSEESIDDEIKIKCINKILWCISYYRDRKVQEMAYECLKDMIDNGIKPESDLFSEVIDQFVSYLPNAGVTAYLIKMLKDGIITEKSKCFEPLMSKFFKYFKGEKRYDEITMACNILLEIFKLKLLDANSDYFNQFTKIANSRIQFYSDFSNLLLELCLLGDDFRDKLLEPVNDLVFVISGAACERIEQVKTEAHVDDKIVALIKFIIDTNGVMNRAKLSYASGWKDQRVQNYIQNYIDYKNSWLPIYSFEEYKKMWGIGE